jgi:hypothetical protein
MRRRIFLAGLLSAGIVTAAGVVLVWPRAVRVTVSNRGPVSLRDVVIHGWHVATDRFWDAIPSFYDLGTVKTVILTKAEDAAGGPSSADVFYWKHGRHNLPEYLSNANVELRRYKLHHSMNALLWHDHGDRPLWPE